jgi:hypothetical protein
VNDYSTFLASKARSVEKAGIIVRRDAIHKRLFDFQAEIVQRMLELGRGAIFASTGLGKTGMQIEWARQVHKHEGVDVLIFAPLAVASQTAREAQLLDVNVAVCREPADIRPGINITNYDRLEKFDLSRFGGVVLDECFAPDTLVDTPDGAITVRELSAGDSIYNASGIDVIADVHRREVQYCVKITVDGKPITSSPNHPYFTERGWVGAQDLEPGDTIIRSSEAVRILRDRVYAEVYGRSILREILLSEVAHEATEIPSQGAYARSGRKARQKSKRMARGQIAGSDSRNQSHSRFESYANAWGSGKDLPEIERNRPQTFRAWGQWSRDDEAATVASGCSWRRMDGGICRIVGSTSSRLSDVLQARLSERRAASRYRGGWVYACQPSRSRREERCDAGYARVESLEVLKPGHPELDKLRDADGRIYLYDLGATRHPSYSVNGLLVHNSSILKSTDGKTRTALIEAAQSVRFRLACTATPAPNDVMELGNHAEFLGVMRTAEMLATYFVHDGGETQKWRLKGHAEKAFWQWVGSWASVVDSPADLGYDGSAYVLPPLRMHEHVLDAPPVSDGSSLFALPAASLMERRSARSVSVETRVAKAAEIMRATPGPWLVWCGLNREADAMKSEMPALVEVRGSDRPEDKESRLIGFSDGTVQSLLSKPSIAGFGMNWQHCHQMIFIGIDDSWESLFQAIRRCWRFGQTEPVDVHLILSSAEIRVLENLKRKERDAGRLRHAMAREAQVAIKRGSSAYTSSRIELPKWLNAAS